MATMGPNDTIHALASGGLPSGIAVIRVSGPLAASTCRAIAGVDPLGAARTLRTLRAPDGTVLDQGLVLFFPAPHSFTGEDVLELHVHGGVAVVDAVSDALAALGLRAAEPGEFTGRAFANGRMDLTAVEGLADLIAAQTEAQRRQAITQHGGVLRDLYNGWARRLLHARALLEAEFDFADEDDVPDDAAHGIGADLAALAAEMDAHLAAGRTGEIVRDGFRIALLGPPNAGKSSLLNAMVARDAAIVTPVPGTTRDVVEVELQRNGLRVVVTDTAGLRETDDVVEAEGIRRARLAAERADLRLWLAPDGTPPPADLDAVSLWTKRDLSEARPAGVPAISVREADGLAPLWHVVDERLSAFARSGLRGTPVPTRARHRDGVEGARGHIREALAATEGELRAEHLRAAAHTLGRITGRVDVEDLLGVIFAEFCVGK